MKEGETSASPLPGFGTTEAERGKTTSKEVGYLYSGKEGATVGLTTRLSAERDQGGSIFIGRFVEAIRETLIRRDVLGIL